jgi:hypothetical protein
MTKVKAQALWDGFVEYMRKVEHIIATDSVSVNPDYYTRRMTIGRYMDHFEEATGWSPEFIKVENDQEIWKMRKCK